jgi:hypothetical protein
MKFIIITLLLIYSTSVFPLEVNTIEQLPNKTSFELLLNEHGSFAVTVLLKGLDGYEVINKVPIKTENNEPTTLLVSVEIQVINGSGYLNLKIIDGDMWQRIAVSVPNNDDIEELLLPSPPFRKRGFLNKEDDLLVLSNVFSPIYNENYLRSFVALENGHRVMRSRKRDQDESLEIVTDPIMKVSIIRY